MKGSACFNVNKLVASELALPPTLALRRRLEFRDVTIFAFAGFNDDPLDTWLAGAGFVPAMGPLRRRLWLSASFGRFAVCR
jgi:hypothetical protein